MHRNIVFVVIAGLLAALFIWAPSYADDTANMLDSVAQKAIDAAKDERWEECDKALAELDAILSKRKSGLKILLDHEEVDKLTKNVAVARAAQKYNEAKELTFELEGLRSTLEYIKEIDKPSWINLF